MDNQFFTSSRGIANNPQVKTVLKANKVRLLPFFTPLKSLSPIFVGWGYKPTAAKARAQSQLLNRPYWALEDGFISWLDHPTNAKPHERLSYIIDKHGIYYDASKPSGIDACLASCTNFNQARIDQLLQQLIKLKVSKYNQPRVTFPAWLTQLKESGSPVILLVDQTFNDASIEYSGGGEHSFNDMLVWALSELKNDASANVVIKVHPDVILGSKKGYLYGLLDYITAPCIESRIHVLSQDVSPTDLIAMCQHVATVSSQLGFEALWQDKSVTCFAWPFYAGRGLTQDLAPVPLGYERASVTIAQLVHSALILYPHYLHPDTQLTCEIEDVLNFLQANFLCRQLHCDNLAIHNVSLWKRSFIPEFVSGSASNLKYVAGVDKAINTGSMDSSNKHLIWGMKSPQFGSQDGVWRIEDGFIRSVGLGADLRRPTSLIIDDLGIYYNGQQPSRLEQLLNHGSMNEYECQRTEKLIKDVKKSAITKYNVELAQTGELIRLKCRAGGQQIVLITGQYQQDLSMQYGTCDIKTNMALLQQVSQDFPNAFIIYKEHPDVYSGVRPGKLDAATVLQYANEYVTNINITSLFTISDRVCTICSLSGFEALIRGIKVSTYGLPFYAGWGLTDDHLDITRRTAKLGLCELVYMSLVVYPRYVNWKTRTLTTPESVIQQLSIERKNAVVLKSGWLSRQGRKARYLLQSLFSSSWGRG
jgi:capsular polysaccharide export protein